jgi:hypothetical protein
MNIASRIADRLTGAAAGYKSGGESIQKYIETKEALEARVDILETRATEASLDTEVALQSEDKEWIQLNSTFNATSGITKDSVNKAAQLARIMYILNPLVKRAVTVQELYVWGSGCTIKATDDVVNEMLHDFFTDPKNQAVIGESWAKRDREQTITGNTFFVFYRNKSNGAARVRTFPLEQITDIICNPEDKEEPWFYLRCYWDSEQVEVKVLYPDINFSGTRRPAGMPSHVAGVRIDWSASILHLKSGGLSDMKFGMPEHYCVLPWAKAYKRFLENFATVSSAYARIAMKLTGNKTPANTAATKRAMQTTITAGAARETNPPPGVGSWTALSGNVDLSAVKTAGYTTGPDEARALRSMVAAGTDTPEHFFGDSDIGNFATSSTLDRPTELKMVARQNMWKYLILTICRFLIIWSAKAPKGALKQAGFSIATRPNSFGGEEDVTVTHSDPDRTLHTTCTFPTILERDVVDRVRAVVQAATLGGSPAEGIIPDRALLFQMLLTALGEKDAENLTNKYYPNPVTQGFIDPADKMANEQMDAQGKADLGKAAVLSAQAKKTLSEKPTPATAAPAPAKKGT